MRGNLWRLPRVLVVVARVRENDLSAVGPCVTKVIAAVATATASSKDYDECRLQLRPMGGAGGPLTQQFRAEQTLQDVFQYLRANGHPTVSSVSTTFPRYVAVGPSLFNHPFSKQYSSSDSSKTLKELGRNR